MIVVITAPLQWCIYYSNSNKRHLSIINAI